MARLIIVTSKRTVPERTAFLTLDIFAVIVGKIGKMKAGPFTQYFTYTVRLASVSLVQVGLVGKREMSKCREEERQVERGGREGERGREGEA